MASNKRHWRYEVKRTLWRGKLPNRAVGHIPWPMCERPHWTREELAKLHLKAIISVIVSKTRLIPFAPATQNMVFG